jgi:cyclic lactone autoinducer peptide
MKKMLALVSAALGSIVALTASGACWGFWFDEAKMPETLK